MKRLGFVDSSKGWKWLNNLDNKLEDEKWNGKFNNSGRRFVWFGLGVELGFKSEVYKGLEIGEGLRKRGNELWGGEDWNSVLVYKYQRGSELKDHIDRNIFDKKVVLAISGEPVHAVSYLPWLRSGFLFFRLL